MCRIAIAIFILISGAVCVSSRQPNILFILPDDLGFYDVGYHGPSVLTPTITNLSTEGVRLEQFYVQPDIRIKIAIAILHIKLDSNSNGKYC